ncbi:MAG: amidohydrolase family protein [Candidatus Melainabacteria bacterium]|nr:amidohydrolase family protein [Candidatus Melainabacteria bacterium]
MPNGLYVIDFHAHLQGPNGLANLCPEEQKSAFFRHAVPLIEQVAHVSEPVHDEFLRHLALNYRNSLSRFIYSCFGKLALMETIRLFKTYGLHHLLASMDRQNIDHAVICSLEPLTVTQELLELTSMHRERISIFASVNRRQPDPVGYLTHLVESGLIAGIKIHPIVGGYACGELFHKTKDLAQLAREASLPIVIHTGHIPVEGLNGLAGCNEVRAIEPLIAAFPEVKFVLAHIGWESWRQVLKLASKYKNVLVETSWQPARIIRRAVDAIGADRVLFGSDYPLFKQSLALRQVEQALSPKEFVMVASTNALRLLRLSPTKNKRRTAS